jgi:hypothetical protein
MEEGENKRTVKRNMSYNIPFNKRNKIINDKLKIQKF